MSSPRSVEFQIGSRCVRPSPLAPPRTGVLWKPLRTSSLARQIAIIGACVRLHNLATDVAEQHRPYVPSRAATVPRRKWRANRRTAAAKRAAVTGRLQRAGLRRPPLPQHE
jgi:hypothetical protein